MTPEQRLFLKWKRDKKIKRVLKCNCGITHEITILYEYWNCPKCKRNLIYGLNPNWRNCIVLLDKILIEENIPDSPQTRVYDYCPETRRKNIRYGEPNLTKIHSQRRKRKSQ